MSDLTRPPGAWWASSSAHAKRTAAGTAAIVIALSLITWNVWASPSNPVSTAVHHALGVETEADKAVDAKALQAKLTAAQTRIWKLEGQLSSSSAQSGSRSGQITQLKNQLADLQSQLGSTKAQLGSAKASLANGKSSGSGSGSSSTGAGGAGHDAGSTGSHSSHTVAQGNSGPSADPGVTTPAAPTKAQVLDQTSRWYGLYTAQSPFNWAEYDQVSQQVGTATNMVGYFQGFDQDFNASAVQRSWANGRLPMMTWETVPAATGNDKPYVEGYTNADVAGGSFDAYITKYAQAVAANAQPMVIRFDHEMNGSWYNWSEGAKQQNGDESYVAMWQHVHDVFQANGANDYVIWNWSPTRIDALGNTKYQQLSYMAKYWPGAEYVDWVGMSGYYRKAAEAPTFTKTFQATIDQLRLIAPDKKILLGEVGATETGTSTSNGQKAQWMTSLFDALADPANDDVIGFGYFSETATTIVDGVRTTNDWRINSRADSLAAFIAGIGRTDTDYDLQEITR